MVKSIQRHCRVLPWFLLSLGLWCGGSPMAQQPDRVRAADAIQHVGEFVMVCGLIVSTNHARSVRGEPTYLNFDKAYPEQDFSAIVWGNDRRHFEPRPETLVNHKACVFGKVELYRGKAQMTLKRPEQLNAVPLVEGG